MFLNWRQSVGKKENLKPLLINEQEEVKLIITYIDNDGCQEFRNIDMMWDDLL